MNIIEFAQKQRDFLEKILKLRTSFITNHFICPDIVFVNNEELNEIFGNESLPITFMGLEIRPHSSTDICFAFLPTYTEYNKK